MAVVAILDFGKPMPIQNQSTYRHQYWCGGEEQAIGKIFDVRKHQFATIRDGGRRQFRFRKTDANSNPVDRSAPKLMDSAAQATEYNFATRKSKM